MVQDQPINFYEVEAKVEHQEHNQDQTKTSLDHPWEFRPIFHSASDREHCACSFARVCTDPAYQTRVHQVDWIVGNVAPDVVRHYFNDIIRVHQNH